MSIEGKKIFITGSTGGIGTAICNKYLDKKCILILTSSSDEKLEKLIKLYGNKHSYYNLDLSNIDNLEEKMQIISKEHKDIDVLVNNAGITDDSLILRMKYSQWSKVINTNLFNEVNFSLEIIRDNYLILNIDVIELMNRYNNNITKLYINIPDVQDHLSR